MAWQQIAAQVGRTVARRLISRGVRAGMNRAQGRRTQGTQGQPPRR